MYSYKYFVDNFDYISERLILRGVSRERLEQIKRYIIEVRRINEELVKALSKKTELEKAKSVDKEAIRNQKSIITELRGKHENADHIAYESIIALPNIPADDLTDNFVVVKEWGQKREFDFKPLDHKELGEKNDLFSLDEGALISGSGYVVYKDFGAALYRALQRLTIDLNKSKGYIERYLPVVLNSDCLFGTGQLPKFKEDLFSISEDKYLSPTSESQLVNLFRGKILSSKELPLKLTANTNCFRREAGGAGTETKGIIRMHQFNKTEIVTICKESESPKILEQMVMDACGILEELNLPYRVIKLAYDDMSFSATKTYDIEVWFPSENRYREISSVSNTLDFQAKRAKIRYKEDLFSKEEKTKYPHILNGSSLAIDRLFAAILENYQESIGGVRVPEKLKYYL